MRKIFTFILIICIPVISSSYEKDDFLFRFLDSESGFIDNQVRSMVMLPDGMMCIQTASAINLYNGSSCQTYPYNPMEIPYTEYSGLTATYYDRTDNLIWCTTRDNIWIFNLNTKEFEYDIRSHLEAYGLGEKRVREMFLDDDDNMWLVTGDGEFWFCDKSGRTAEKIELLEDMQHPMVFSQYEDKVWMLSLNGTLAEYDYGLRAFRSVKKNLVKVDGASHMDMDICSRGDIWIMYDNSLHCYDSAEGTIHRLDKPELGERDLFTSIAMDDNDRLWVGTARSGVSIIDCKDKSVKTLPYLEHVGGKKVYHHSDISQIYADHRKGVWIATLSEGLMYWNPDIYHLRTINDDNLSRGRMTDENVKCMVEDNDGNILIGTIKGLFKYNPQTDEMSIPYPELKDELCISLYRDRKGRIWLGTFYNGAYLIHGGGIKHFYWKDDTTVDASYLDSSPNYNCVRSFHEDDKGNFWISVYGGVGKFDPMSGQISMLRDEWPELGRYMIVRDICDCRNGYFLVSGDNGSFLYSPEKEMVYIDSLSTKYFRQSNHAIVDSRNLLWVATSGGLSATDLNSGREYFVDASGELGSGGIMSLASDELGNIWASTFSQIYRITTIKTYSGYNFSVSTFKGKDGVSSGPFFQKSVLRHSSGDIYFGGTHGITVVTPEKLYQSNYRTTPFISSFSVNGKPLDKIENELVLKHDESFISIAFSNFNYANPAHTTYKYMLENFDKGWNTIYSQSLGRATYTYLEPGKYVFRAIAANNDTDWSDETVVNITILHPWYQSNFAYLIYILIVIGIGIMIYKFTVKSARKKMIEKQKEDMRKQREALDQMKFRFFTNISHELRTPLSLILLPLEKMLKSVKDKNMHSQLETMYGNANQLLQLVNHLLDFRKLEMGGEKLELANGDICEFLANQLNFFRDAADRKGISIEYDDNTEKPIMAFDKSKVQKIVNNLMSNALKFTPEGGHICLRLSQTEAGSGEFLVMEVSDSGIGIPQKDLKNIFDRFYQSRNSSDISGGSGIGLSLVKQYVEMHGGNVHVESAMGEGTTFRIEIPIKVVNEYGTIQEFEESIRSEVEEIVQPAPEIKHTLLVVDDNDDFRNYISGELSKHYHVICAKSGEEGLDIIMKKEPDMLVCDVMMPGIDGFEVTNRLKTNILTSHIPVILLTARTSDDFRLKGYENGADAYLTKPFKIEILEARIRNLIVERQKRISDISKSSHITPSSVTSTSLDQKLMSKVIESIEKNIGNMNYSVEELSSDVCMHRMTLYRKLQSLCGMTPSEFIRTMRIKRAAQILKENPDISITELAESVGFNVTRYFTKHFKEMYGVTPSQYKDA